MCLGDTDRVLVYFNIKTMIQIVDGMGRQVSPALNGNEVNKWLAENPKASHESYLKHKNMIKIPTGKKAAVLAALYNASKPQGMGWLQYDSRQMTEEEAENILTDVTSFDYVGGRVMKVDLTGDEFDPRLYDRDNGEGAALRSISHLLNTEQEDKRSVARNDAQ